ncbi:hypothetical protein [Thalassococcus sp. S3]|uniref:hypothetical protein n=1 Tax=Thalassococcus sp. S3 TaxID=2017482 RepID=UPI0010247714|nr:hypothetical protein [Thalassococcus sp. S3]QBF33391.1 hypothetical protein CFI11_19565 [Thalassococcus sp. S3]
MCTYWSEQSEFAPDTPAAPQVVVVRLEPDTFDQVEPALTWHFESFASRTLGAEGGDDFRAAIRQGLWQCWVVSIEGSIRAVALTHVTSCGAPMVEITHCAGQGRADWQSPLMDGIEAWAAEIGAHQIRATARPGWRGFLYQRTYRVTHLVMERPVRPPTLSSVFREGG